MSKIRKTFDTLLDAVKNFAQTKPDHIAFVSKSGDLTYRQLETRSSSLAAKLDSVGVERNERVCYLGKNSSEAFEILLACMKLGAVLTPLNWRLAPMELARVIADTKARILFVTEEYAGYVDTLREAGIRDIVYVGSCGPDSLEHWRNHPARATDYSPTLSDIAVQLYSSGTTGRPKGVMLMHRGYRFAVGFEGKDWPQWTQWKEDEVIFVSTPIFHVSGLGWGIKSLFYGGTTILRDKFDPLDVIQSVEKYRVTRLPFVPATFQTVLELLETTKADLSSLRHIQYGASRMHPDLIAKAMKMVGCDMVQTYGLTETGFGVVALNPEHHDPNVPGRLSAAGRALPGVEVKIAQGDWKNMPGEAAGEIYIRSPSNMAGYWNLPDVTARAVDADGWLHTGDVGFIDGDGFLHISGRVDDMVITGGENVFPAEVEDAICSHPAVREAAIIGIPSEKWGEELKAFVATENNMNVTAEDLVAYARGRIAGYKIPKSFEFISELPRNAAGKVLKSDLKKRSLPPTASTDAR